jgi:hypothetical protein
MSAQIFPPLSKKCHLDRSAKRAVERPAFPHQAISSLLAHFILLVIDTVILSAAKNLSLLTA